MLALLASEMDIELPSVILYGDVMSSLDFLTSLLYHNSAGVSKCLNLKNKIDSYVYVIFWSYRCFKFLVK